jgi:hypothetical protein
MKLEFGTQGAETGVLDPRPKLLRFHLPGPATHPYRLNQEAWWRERNKAYYMDWDILWKEAEWALISSSDFFGVQIWAIGLNRQRTGGNGSKVGIVKQSCHRCVLVGHYLSPCSGRGSGVVLQSHCHLARGPSWGRFTVGGGFCPLLWRC